MSRDKTEIKLLIVRQNLKDALDRLLDGSDPISMKTYRSLKVKYILAGELLQEHRKSVFGQNKRRGNA